MYQNKERQKAKAREWYLRNRDKTIARAKARNVRIRQSMPLEEYRAINNANARKWRLNNPDRYGEICRRSRIKNWPQRREDRQYRLRNRICSALRAFCGLVFRDRVGCSREFMGKVIGKERYEFLGMYQPEWGKEFDHIIPLSAFDLTNPEHLLRACHHTNIRYISASENRSKQAKVLPGTDIMALPRVAGDDALMAARIFISGYRRGGAPNGNANASKPSQDAFC